MEITIDKESGFCFGVINAISVAERELKKHGKLYCLGDIVHNNKEVERLEKSGLITIRHEDLPQLHNTRVLIRAHGEPPQTYKTALENNIEIIDASCPVVLRLQNKVKRGAAEALENDGQIVIFGKKGHAEVNGLTGQTLDNAIVVESDFSGLEKIDFSKPVYLYSQTTQNKETYAKLIETIKEKISAHACDSGCNLRTFQTICGLVSNRGPRLAQFAANHHVIIFVSGKKSSNGKYLFNVCKQHNPNSYFISDSSEIDKAWFANSQKTGICGATSTPMWLMDEVAEAIGEMTQAHKS